MKTMSEQFAVSNRVGKIGESEFVRRCNQWGYEVVDVSNHTEYQGKDIDFLLTLPGGREISIEVKSDTFTGTGNVFLETVSNLSYGSRGWMEVSEAEVLVYIFVNGLSGHKYDCYWFNFEKLKSLDLSSFREREVKSKVGGKIKVTKGRAVPVRWLEERGVIMKSYDWGFAKRESVVNNWR